MGKNTRIQIGSSFIELGNDIDFPIDFSFADITLNGARTGGVSRVVDVQGTDDNIKVLGLYFDVDLSNLQFNRNKKTECSVIQNEIEIFNGYIQLMEVSKLRRKISYKISVFDDVANFFNEMGEKELSDLSFPELNHIFNRANIISSWANTSGFTYPQYAKGDNIYTLRDFKPAIYEWEYFKKIFAENGYQYNFEDFDSDTIRMDQRIIPFNGKDGDEQVAEALQKSYTVYGINELDNFQQINLTQYPFGYLPFLNATTGIQTTTYCAPTNKIDLTTLIQNGQTQYDTGTDEIENKAGNGRTFTINSQYQFDLKVRAKNSGGTVVAWSVFNPASQVKKCEIVLSIVARSLTDPNKVSIIDAGQTTATFVAGGTYSFASGFQPLATGLVASSSQFGIFAQGEKLDFHFVVYARYFKLDGTLYQSPVLMPMKFQDATLADVKLEFDIDVTDLSIKVVPDIQELQKDAPVDCGVFIPKKIKQRDFMSAISKTYNLIFEPDPIHPKKLKIKTRDQYYDEGDEWDWTYKIDTNQPVVMTWLSNSEGKKISYQYKADKDAINTSYQDEVRETYGRARIEMDNEYTVSESVRELIYSPTPSIPSKIGRVLPSINGINPESNIRVLLHNGVQSAVAYPFHDDLLPSASTLSTVTTCNNTSMFDDDITPNFSICFDSPVVLFHSEQQSNTSNYLYNLHHKNEATTINEGRMLSAYFDLTEVDAQKLARRLDWKIFIRDFGWFYISSVQGYNANKRTLTAVKLVTVDDKQRIKFIKPKEVPGNPSVFNPSIQDHLNEVGHDTNIIIGTATVDGSYNFVVGNDVKIVGDANNVLSSSVQVLGSGNTVGTGLNQTKVLADNIVPSSIGVYVNQKKINESIFSRAVADYEAEITDEFIEATSATTLITLPEVTDFEAGKYYTIKNNTGADITINSASLIDDVSGYALTNKACVKLMSGVTDWIIVASF